MTINVNNIKSYFLGYKTFVVMILTMFVVADINCEGWLKIQSNECHHTLSLPVFHQWIHIYWVVSVEF